MLLFLGFLVIILYTCLNFTLFSQDVSLKWTKHLGPTFNDQFLDISVDLDCEFVAVGQIPSNGNKIMLAKYSPEGNLNYNMTIGGGSSSFALGKIKISPILAPSTFKYSYDRIRSPIVRA